jgi:hypothetical protein
VLVLPSLADAVTRAAAYATLARGGTVVFGELPEAQADVVVASAADVVDLSDRIDRELQAQGGLRRAALGRHGRIARAVLRRGAGLVLGSSLRTVIAVDAVPEPAAATLDAVGIAVL